jgi:hypothetical protein
MAKYFRSRQNVSFILGPLDYDLMVSAFSILYRGHNAAKILLHLYYERGKRKLPSDSFIQFTNYYLADLGITRQVKNELLRRLEGCQLVKVRWRKGMSPYVKILDRKIDCGKEFYKGKPT